MPGRLRWDSITGVLCPETRLSARDRAALEDERARHHVRMGRWLLPITLFFHVALAFFYRGDDPALAAWEDGVRAIHGASIPFAAATLVVAWRSSWTTAHRWLGDVVVAGYILVGALLTANAQRVHATMQIFVVCVFAAMLMGRARPPVFFGALALALAIAIAAVLAWQTDPAARVANIPGAVAFSVVAAAGFVVIHRSRVLELKARCALKEVNVDLERRVQEQVGEKLTRAREIDALNVQLAERVRERSHELSIALARLADRQTHQPLLPGTVLVGRVVVEACLGAGGMGVVYRGFDRLAGAPVAIKLVQATSASELEGLQRFLREAEAVAAVRHDAVVRTLHVDVTDDGQLFHVMELVEGMTLDERLVRGGPLAAGVAARVGAVLAEALSAAHAAGVIHRDVKPSNVMLTRSPPGLKLLDFGLSKLRDSRVARGGTHGLILGTPQFMAPEQFEGPAQVTDRTDLYALGSLLFVALANRLPFEASSPIEWMAAHASREPLEIASLVPTTPATLAALVMSCLRKDPARRPAAGELAVALNGIADAEHAPPLDQVALPHDIAGGEPALAPTVETPR